MNSSDLMSEIAQEWRLADPARGVASSMPCPSCRHSDLYREATDEQHPRVHGLVAALEEVVEGAVEDYLNSADRDLDAEAWESRLASLDTYRAALRRRARRIASEALAVADVTPLAG